MELAALDTAPAGSDPGDRERRLLRAYLAAFKTVEGAVYYEVARVVTAVASPAALNFVDAIDKLAAQLRLPRSWVSELKSHRVMRNQIEHGGGLLPRRATIEELIASSERLLVEVLHVSRESLERDLPPKKPSENARPSVWPAVFEAIVDPATATSRLSDAIAGGIARLQTSKRHSESLTTTLATDARTLLVLAARALWESRAGTGDAVPDYEPVDDFLRLETELLDAARSGARLDPARLRLHARRVGLCEEAGWFVRDRGKLHVAGGALPALALGPELRPNRETLAVVLELICVDPAWGLALRAALLGAPDSAESWLELLLECEEPTNLLAEVVAHAFVLGAVPADTPIKDADLAYARDFVLHGLRLLGPRMDARIAWSLSSQAFWSCVLCLATASSVLRDRLPGAPGVVPQRIAGLVATLELEPAVLAREAEALGLLAMPWHALRSRRLTHDLSVTGHTLYGRTAIEGAHPLIPWVLDLIAPMALEMGVLDILTELEYGYFGALLIQTPRSRPIWITAWSRILRDNEERALDLWVRALREQLVPASVNGDWTGEFLRPTFALLHDSRAEEVAKRAVRSEILTWPLPQAAETHHRELFAWAAPRSEDWEAGLLRWKAQPTLSWQLLRDCGAPHAWLARWALHFLRERESVPQAFRDGPVGIVTSPNVRTTQTGPWKAAFQEARECLDWLLEHGDEGALHVIADASLGPHPGDVECDVPYVYHEEMRLWFSLSQVFWSRVISRAAGRAVLYERLAAGKYIGIHCWPNFDWQYVLDAVSDDQAALGREAAKIFEAYVRFCSVHWHPHTIRHERPWEDPPANISVNWHTAMLLLAAWHDLPVLDEWRRVVVRFGDRPSMSEFGPALAAVFAELARRHPVAVERAAPDLPDDLLRAFCVDRTGSFWATWLTKVGLGTFLRRIDELGVEDLGTGIVSALVDSNQTVLAARLAEPRYFTPFLRAAPDPAIYRDEHLRRLLWSRPRGVADLDPLFDEPYGPWLDALIELSSAWPPAARRAALTALARYSTAIVVRRVCLAAVSDNT